MSTETYYQKNIEKRKSYQRQYNAINKEHIREYYYPKYKDDTKKKYYCHICNINCIYVKVYNKHMTRNKHLTKETIYLFNEMPEITNYT